MSVFTSVSSVSEDHCRAADRAVDGLGGGNGSCCLKGCDKAAAPDVCPELRPASEMKAGMAGSSGSCWSCLAQSVAVLEPHLQPWGSALRHVPPRGEDRCCTPQSGTGQRWGPPLSVHVCAALTPCSRMILSCCCVRRVGNSSAAAPSPALVTPALSQARRRGVCGVAVLGLCPSPLAAPLLALCPGLE